MTIRFACTGCGRTLRVADHLAGRKAKCPNCQTALYIPDGAEAGVTPAPAPAKRRAAPPTEEPEDRSDEEQEPEDRPDEEQEPERPRRRKKGKKKAKKSLLLPLLLIGGAGLLLLVGLGVTAIFVWPMIFGGGPQDDYFFMPDDTQIVGTIHVNQLMNSGAMQQAKSQIPAFGQQLSDASNQLGSINLNDIDQVLIGSQTITNRSQPPFVMVIHFSKPVKPAEFEAAFQKQNITFTESKVGGFTLYDGKYSNPGQIESWPPAFVAADEKRIVLAESPILQAFLKRNKKPDLADKLQEAIKQTDFTSTIAFATYAKNAFPKSPPGRPGAPGGGNPFGPPTVSFDKVNALTVTAKVGTDIDVTATALCQDAAAAAELRDGVKKNVDFYRNALAVAAMFGKGLPPEVSDLLNLDFQMNGSTVAVSKAIKVAPLIEFAKTQMAGQGADQQKSGKDK